MKNTSITRYFNVLRREPLPLLAKEAAWRMRRRFAENGLRSRIRAKSRLQWRNVVLYRPAIDRISSTQRNAILSFAESIKRGQFPFLSYGTVDLGLPPRWNVDFISGVEWPAKSYAAGGYVRHDGSDVKAPYELSRLQFLPVLGKAYWLTKDETYRELAKRLLANWVEQNPPLEGVNWAIPMEASLRLMSICSLLSVLSPLREHEQPWLKTVLRSIRDHILYIEAHSEFSHLLTSNHYLSNAAGLYFASLFVDGAGMQRRRRKYRHALEREMLRQVYADGGDYESSTGYHVLVAQLFTLAAIANRAADTSPFSAAFTDRLNAMFRWMNALVNASGELPIVGDCDDGRAELLSDDLMQITTLPLCDRNPLRVSGLLGVGHALLGTDPGSPEDAAWYGLDGNSHPEPPRSRLRQATVLLNSGIAVARANAAEVQFFAIPNGIGGRGSHTHNDKLSLVVRLRGTEVLCDPGTGCYTRNAELRNRLRRTAAHNTLVVDGREQNTIDVAPTALFRSGDEARMSPIEQWTTDGSVLMRASHEGYASIGVRHTRTVALSSDDNVVSITDHMTGSGAHDCELNFHVAPGFEVDIDAAGTMCRVVRDREEWLQIAIPDGWAAAVELDIVSNLYGQARPSRTLRMRARLSFPAEVSTLIFCSTQKSQTISLQGNSRLLTQDRRLSLQH